MNTVNKNKVHIMLSKHAQYKRLLQDLTSRFREDEIFFTNNSPKTPLLYIGNPVIMEGRLR
jgi:hypothetical protein